MTTTRKPAIARTHPADAIPDRPAPPAPAAVSPAPTPDTAPERLTEQHNVRIRPSTKARITKAVDRLRYETGDRSISIASITDAAIANYLQERGC